MTANSVGSDGKVVTQAMPGRIPVTILTGFLGSGKTTLLNRILTENHGKRIAVIENEFGEIGIDHELVLNSEEEIFEMNNGCICCTVRGDLIRILGKLAQKRNKFDYIIIETTGMADPSPVAQTFYIDEEIQQQFQLDGVVTLVDSKHISMHLDTSEECREQIGFADVILLNKTDLVDKNSLSSLKERLSRMNRFAVVHETEKAAIPFSSVLDLKAFDLQRALDLQPHFLEPEYSFEWLGSYELAAGKYRLKLDDVTGQWMQGFLTRIPRSEITGFQEIEKQVVLAFSHPLAEVKNGEKIPISSTAVKLDVSGRSQEFFIDVPESGSYAFFFEHCPHEYKMSLELQEADGNWNAVKPSFQKHFHGHHHHEEEVSSVGIELRGDLNEKKFQAWIGNLLQTKGQDIYRSKGVLSFSKSNQRYIFQGVHMLMDGQFDRAWGSDERKNLIVFIGKNLNREELNLGLKSCLE